MRPFKRFVRRTLVLSVLTLIVLVSVYAEEFTYTTNEAVSAIDNVFEEIHPDWGISQKSVLSIGGFEPSTDNELALKRVGKKDGYDSPFQDFYPVYDRSHNGLRKWYCVAKFEDEIKARSFADDLREALTDKYIRRYGDKDSDKWDNYRNNEIISLYITFDINERRYSSSLDWYVVLEYKENDRYDWRHDRYISSLERYI